MFFVADDAGDDGRSEFVAPPWVGPPDGELPTALPLAVVLGRSERGVVALSHALAYSTGVVLELVALGRGVADRNVQRVFHEQHLPPEAGDPSPAFLRIGIELPDGQRVSNLAGRGHRDAVSRPDRPVLRAQGGSSGSGGRGTVK